MGSARSYRVSKVVEAVERLLRPELLAPLAVAAALFLLSGLFNILYTMSHDPSQFLAAMSRIGPVPSHNLQNVTELVLVFLGYAMMVLGSYTLYNAARGSRAAARYRVLSGTALLIVGALLVAALAYVKTGY